MSSVKSLLTVKHPYPTHYLIWFIWIYLISFFYAILKTVASILVETHNPYMAREEARMTALTRDSWVIPISWLQGHKVILGLGQNFSQ